MLRYLEAKAVAQGLREHFGYKISDRTVQRWTSGVSEPKPQDYAAIRRLLGLPEESEHAEILRRLDQIMEVLREGDSPAP